MIRKNDISTNINPENQNPGFNQFSELINGRVAMISFIIIFFLELILKKPIISLL